MKREKKLILITITGILFIRCAHLKEARTAYQEKDYKKAAQLLEEAVASDSTDVEAYLLLSRSYTGLKSTEKALKAIERALELKTGSRKIIEEHSRVRILMGDHFLSQRKLQRAQIQYRAAEPYDSTRYELVIRIADLYLRMALLEKAAIRYNRLLSFFPDSANARTRLSEIQQRTQKAAALYEKGLKAFNQKNLTTAKSHLTRALKEKADFNDAEYYMYITEGRLLFKKGSRNALWDAIELFGNAKSLRENSAEPNYWLAKAYEKKDSKR